MNILVAPDSFKSSLSALEAARAMEAGARRAFPQARIRVMPLADGGEGTVDAMVAAVPNGKSVRTSACDPLGQKIEAKYGLLGEEAITAVIEMAAASGIMLVDAAKRNPLNTTTYGTGELIAAASHTPGIERILIGLGGSATNDGGAGALQALGVAFYDAAGNLIAAPLIGRDVERIAGFDLINVQSFPLPFEIVVACDVTNPLCGPSGASVVFGPQKGANSETVKRLDAALDRFALVLDELFVARGGDGVLAPVAKRPGAGAAGGLCAGLISFFPHSKVRSGIDVVLETVGFDAALIHTNLILTGEGKLDAQTLSGKAVMGILRRANNLKVPVMAFAGSMENEAVEELRLQGLAGAYALLDRASSVKEAIENAQALLEKTVYDALRAT